MCSLSVVTRVLWCAPLSERGKGLTRGARERTRATCSGGVRLLCVRGVVLVLSSVARVCVLVCYLDRGSI